MNVVTGLGAIENSGPNHLKAFLRAHSKGTLGIDIAVAFVTQSGFTELLPSLKKAAMNGPVRILTGLYQCFTEPQALRLLLAEQNDTSGRLSVRLSINPHFHWKAYFLQRARTAKIVIGSSNMTADGLLRSGEMNAVISLRRPSSSFMVLHKPFEEEWRDARPLMKEQIERYAKARPKVVRRIQPSMPLQDILGARKVKGGQNRPADQISERQFWRDVITGFADDDTEEVIEDTTNWNKKGYLWYSSWEPRHRRGDRIVLFDNPDNYVRLVQVMDTTRTPSITPNGRQFTAYRSLSKSHKRRLSKQLVTRLVAHGLLRKRSHAKSARKLTSSAFERLRAEIGL
jgi:HKD family nuclease